jgi:hypothetical protein
MCKEINKLQAKSASTSLAGTGQELSRRLVRRKTEYDIMVLTTRQLAKERGLPPGFRKNFTPEQLFEIKRKQENERLERQERGKEIQAIAKELGLKKKSKDVEVERLSDAFELLKMKRKLS